MAESDKTAHIPESIMERFSVRNLSETELTKVARHLTGCADCEAEFVSTLRRQRGVADLSFSLAPEFWLRHEHLDYEQLVEFAEGTLDANNRELIDAHLKVCPTCQEDVRSFLAFREQIAPELRVSYSPEKEAAQKRLPLLSWWRGLAWKPIYSAALVALGIALVIGAALLLNPRPESQQSQQVPTPQVSPDSSQENSAANPSPPPTPNQSPKQKPNSAEVMVVLNDRGGTITVDKSGNVAGLDDVPNPTRVEISKVLLSERRRTRLAKSEELRSERTEWILPKRLKRGEIYTWTVVAIVDGKEIVSPGPSSSEMKFQGLSAADFSGLE